MSIDIWADKYIPQTLDEYVWRDPIMRSKFEEYISDGAMPHLLLSGKAGLGKTSLVKLMIRLLGVPEGDILFIKASNQRKIENLQAQIMGFVQTYPMIDNHSQIKYIVLDEVDALSILSQKFLRSEMDQYAETARFIMTCNYPEKVMEPIISRCQQFHFEALDMENFIIRVSGVLDAENVQYAVDDLVEYIETAYPDLRKCLGLVQKNTVKRILHPKPKSDIKSLDWMMDAVALFGKKQFLDARTLIIQQASPEEYDDIFRWMYQNLNLWGTTDAQQDRALVAIRDGLYRDNFVADKEINLAATFAELTRIAKGE